MLNAQLEIFKVLVLKDGEFTCFDDTLFKIKELPEPEKSINQIITICKFLVNPAISVAGERSFSAAWQLKTWLRSTMMQARFSNLSRGSMPPHPRPYLSRFERIRFKRQKRHVTLNPLLFTMLGTRRHNMAAVLLNMDIDHPRWQISNWSKACMFAFAYENLVVNLLSFSLVVA